MLSASIIASGGKDKLFFDSLNKLEGVEWNGIYSRESKMPKQLDQALIFSSPEIIIMISELLVVLDSEFCNFNFLADAIRNGCHLFLTNNLGLNTEERKQLIQLAKEGGTHIQIRNDFLFQPFHKKIISQNYGTSYLEIRQSVQSEPDNLKEILLNNLLLILKTTRAPIHRINVFCGTAPSRQPDILNIHLNFTNGSTASLTVTFNEYQKIHTLYIYHNGEVSCFDFIRNLMGEEPDKSMEKSALMPENTLVDQISGFVKNITEKSNPVYSLNDEIEVFLLLEKIRVKFELHSVTL